jgi:hypothetical protein
VPAAVVDIGINLDEELNAETGKVELVGKVVDIGDLRVYGAFSEIDAHNALFNGGEMRMDQRFSSRQVEALTAGR